MKLSQNDLEHIKDLLQKGEITLNQAHVMMVRNRRVMLVTSRIPADVRRALNAAVKSGELGHMKKLGHKPEVYFHPTFGYLVPGERNSHERNVLASVASVMARRKLPSDPR